MQFVPSIPPATTSPATRPVKELTGVQAVKPVHPREPESAPLRHEVVPAAYPQGSLPAEDRRKACRRIRNQKVLIELRSGLDRRQHNLMEGGVADHIDEKA